MEYGWLSLIPPFLVIIFSLWFRSSFEALVIGCIVGFVMLDGWGFFDGFITSLYSVMQSEDSVWVILVCGLYGSLIGLMVRSGGAMQFGEKMLRYIKTKRSAMMGSWFLGLFIFLDDYLSALTVGITMKRITDHFKIPREYLAYIVNTMAAPVCVLVPISTWSIFIGVNLESAGFATKDHGLSAYMSVIPYVVYGWVSILLIPLVTFGIIPMMGKMKAAFARVEATGQIIPDGPKLATVQMEPFSNGRTPKSLYFLLPLLVLLASTLAFQDSQKPGIEIDALKGIIIAVLFTFFFFIIKKIGPFQEVSETVFSGFNSMMFALALLMMSYVLKDINDKMGLTAYVINSVKPIITKELLPVVVFIALSFIAYTTGSSWGMYAIALPIVIPLANQLDSNIALNIGAVISAGTLGANACLYSDATVLTAQSTGINNLQHSISQLPYALLSFVISCFIYWGLGQF